MSQDDEIRLTHSLYKSGQRGDCGNFSAESVSVNGSEYTSRLSIHSYMRAIINCTLSGVIIVETIAVRAGG